MHIWIKDPKEDLQENDRPMIQIYLNLLAIR